MEKNKGFYEPPQRKPGWRFTVGFLLFFGFVCCFHRHLFVFMPVFPFVFVPFFVFVPVCIFMLVDFQFYSLFSFFKILLPDCYRDLYHIFAFSLNLYVILLFFLYRFCICPNFSQCFCLWVVVHYWLLFRTWADFVIICFVIFSICFIFSCHRILLRALLFSFLCKSLSYSYFPAVFLLLCLLFF